MQLKQPADQTILAPLPPGLRYSYQMAHNLRYFDEIFWAVCVGLPVDYKNMKTSVKYPIEAGDTVIVSCVDNHNLMSGNTVLTCIAGREFTVLDRPICTPGYTFWIYTI